MGGWGGMKEGVKGVLKSQPKKLRIENLKYNVLRIVLVVCYNYTFSITYSYFSFNILDALYVNIIHYTVIYNPCIELDV